MARPRLPIGAYGTINLDEVEKGKWRARTLYRFPDGKRRQVERHARTKAAAENVLKNALLEIETPTASVGMTVDLLGASFIQSKIDANLADGTIDLYQGKVNGPIHERLGSMLVKEVTPMHVQAFMTAVHKENGAGTAQTCKAVLSGMFKLAIRSNVIRITPVAGLEAVKPSGEKAAKGLTPEAMRVFLATASVDPMMRERDMPDLWEFMSYTGCRIAEALALRWRFVDDGAGMVTLGPVVTRKKGRGSYIREPGKTYEWRTIVVPVAAMQLLERRKLAVPEGELGLVFPTEFGGIRTTSSVEMLWLEQRTRLGYPAFTSHGFRKTVATMLDKAGMSPRDIAEYLGHKNPSMTMDKYMDKNTQSKNMAEALSSMFGVSSGSGV